MSETRKCPPLGMGSVDFAALHEAATDPKSDLAAALEAATTRVEPPAPLTGEETLADLKRIAADEGVDGASDWHKDDYRAAIVENRKPRPSSLEQVDAVPEAAADPAPAQPAGDPPASVGDAPSGAA